MSFAEFKDYWLLISPAVMPIVGVVVGGLVTYFATSRSESKKRRQASEDAKQELRRKGLVRVMRWAEHLANGVLEMEGHLVYLNDDPEKAEGHFSDYKKSAYWLSTHPIPPEHRIFLPGTTEDQCKAILVAFAYLEQVSIARQKPETPHHRHPNWNEVKARLQALREQIWALQEQLADQFKKLYE